jgi:hypothetical protein
MHLFLWERSSFVNSQLLTKVLDVHQNYLCNFYLRGGVGLPEVTVYILWQRAGPLVWERSSFVNSQLATKVLDLRQNHLCNFHLRGGVGLPEGTVYILWQRAGPLVWERSSFVNSQLTTEVLDLRQNHLCDFHLREGIGLSEGIYPLAEGRSPGPIHYPGPQIRQSHGSHSRHRVITDRSSYRLPLHPRRDIYANIVHICYTCMYEYMYINRGFLIQMLHIHVCICGRRLKLRTTFFYVR